MKIRVNDESKSLLALYLTIRDAASLIIADAFVANKAVNLLSGNSPYKTKKDALFLCTIACTNDKEEAFMQFGNWIVTKESIEWNSDELNRFAIPKDDCTAMRYDKRGSFFYDWILKATEEDWLSQDDLYDLNFAFVYAVAKWGLEFSYDTFDATLEEQYEQFDEEEEDEDWNF